MTEKTYPYDDCIFKIHVQRPDRYGQLWGLLDVTTPDGEAHLITPRKVEVFNPRHWNEVAKDAARRNSGDQSVWYQRTEEIRVALYEDESIGQSLISSDDSGFGLVGSVIPAVDLSMLQEQTKNGDFPAIEHLPFLGKNVPIFIKDYSTILTTDPKGGKTELLHTLFREWAALGYQIGFYTEEPEVVWRARLERTPSLSLPDRVGLVFALGRSHQDILRTIEMRRDHIVIIDTTKLLGVENENDVGHVSRAVTPIIAACRLTGSTLIFVHHSNKSGGERGKALAGSHAWLALVDLSLEIGFDTNNPKRRKMKGLGRVVQVPEVVYEMGDDNLMKFVGDASDMEWDTVKDRIWEAATDEWLKTDEIRDRIEGPKPSRQMALKALTHWTNQGNIERDPPISAGQKSGARYRWKFVSQT